MMLNILGQILPFLLIAVLVVNLLQRGITKTGSTAPDQDSGAPVPRPAPEQNLARSDARRIATLILAGFVLALWAAVLVLQRSQAPDWTGLALLAGACAVGFSLRGWRKVFPVRCRWCGRRLPVGVTLGFDAAATARYEAGSCPAAACGPAPGPAA